MKCELWQRRYKCGERWRNLYGAMVSGARLYARATTCWSQMVLAGPGSEEQVDHSYADQHHQLQLYLDIGNTNHCQHCIIICPHPHHPIHKTRPIRQRSQPRRSEPDQMVLARLRVRGTDQALIFFTNWGWYSLDTKDHCCWAKPKQTKLGPDKFLGPILICFWLPSNP